MDPEYEKALAKAIALSLTEAYKGCGVHVCAVVGLNAQGSPEIKGYRLDNFFDSSTLVTVVNGEISY